MPTDDWLNKYEIQNWEPLDVETYRLYVPGGWIYRVIIDHIETPGPLMSVVFVPDPSAETYVKYRNLKNEQIRAQPDD